MGHERERYRRSSIRLPGHDYALPGAYFVTVCTHDRQRILDAPRFRDVVERTWRQIPAHFPSTRLDEFIIMPNHAHGIVWIVGTNAVGAQHAAPLRQKTPAVRPGSLGAIVRSFKSAAAKRINEIRQSPGAPVWQRNFYERVVRDEDELGRIREYVHVNPLEWEFDRENPDRCVDQAYERQWRWLEGAS